MSSEALSSWEGPRQSNLDELVAVHHQVAGTGPGRKWTTRQLNGSLLFRLASEFQGFARDLHDEAADVFAEWAAPDNGAVRNVVHGRMTESRQLDRGNAQPGSLGSDFGRLGLELWPALNRRNSRTPIHQATSAKLNDLRNAIAHDQIATVEELRRAGYPVTLATFKWGRS